MKFGEGGSNCLTRNCLTRLHTYIHTYIHPYRHHSDQISRSAWTARLKTSNFQIFKFIYLKNKFIFIKINSCKDILHLFLRAQVGNDFLGLKLDEFACRSTKQSHFKTNCDACHLFITNTNISLCEHKA